MKKILFIIALSITGVSFAQTPEVTPEQLENSRVVHKQNEQLKAKIAQRVNQIIDIAQLDGANKGELLELVIDQISQIDNTTKSSDIKQINTDFKSQLKSLLGKEKFNKVSNAMTLDL